MTDSDYALHEALLDTWASTPLHAQESFIRDGIIDPTRWARAPRKVLFLLKEAYGEEHSTTSWDLRAMIRDHWGGHKYKIWRTAASWAYAVQHAENGVVPAFPTSQPELERMNESLLASATINIKKSRGRTSSDHTDLGAYVSADGSMIRQQVALIKPDLIIAGNVWDLVHQLWPNKEQLYERVWRVDGIPLVSVAHPANHFPNWLNYYALAALLQNSGVLTHR